MEGIMMNTTLIIVAVFTILMAMIGFRRGLIRTLQVLFAIIALICIIILIIYVREARLEQSKVGTIVGLIMLAIIFIMYALIRSLINMFKSFTDIEVIELLDRLFGGICGIILALVFVWGMFKVSAHINLGDVGVKMHEDIAASNVLTGIYRINYMHDIIELVKKYADII